MKVSIITVCFNSEATIRHTLESVSKQNYKQIEHIIVDGASTDKTLDIINSWKAHPICVVSGKDGGIYEAMNKGLHMCTGDVIGFLNSDDRYFDEYVLSRIIEGFMQTAVNCVYGDLVIVRSSDRHVIRTWLSGQFDRRKVKHGWVPPHPAFYVARSVYESVGDFNLRFRIAADIDWMLRVVIRADTVAMHVPYFLVAMNAGGVSTGGFRAVASANKEVYQSCKLHGNKLPAWFVIAKLMRKLRQ